MKHITFQINETLSSYLVKTSLGVGFSVLLSVSCNKDSRDQQLVPEPNQVVSSVPLALDPCDAHAYNLIHTAAIGLLNDSKNDVFKSTVHQMAAQKFDGEESVLLKDLDESLGNGILNNKLSGGLAIHGQKSAISKFTSDPYWDTFQTLSDVQSRSEIINGFNYCGSNSFLHIYIPNLDSVDQNENPTIVIGYEENDQCIYPGYQIDANGNVKVIDVDETFSEQHLVWVIGINESVDEFGKLPTQNMHIDSTNDLKRSNKNQTRASIYLKVNVRDIMITIPKSEKKNWECWIRGRLDVAQISVGLFSNICERSCALGSNCIARVKKKNFGKEISIPTGPESDVAAISGCTPGHGEGGYESTLYGNKQIVTIFFELDKKHKFDYSLPYCTFPWKNSQGNPHPLGDKVEFVSRRNELLGEFYYHTVIRHDPLPSTGKVSQWFDLKHIKVRFQSVLLD